MALIGNYTVLAKNPGKAFSGSTISDNRSQTNKSGANRGRFTGWAAWSPKAAQPNGYLHPYAWIMPIDPGGLSSYTLIGGTGTLAASGAMGVNGEAALSGSGELNATGQLVVSAVAALSGSGTLNGDVVAVLAAAADLAGVGSMTAAMTALGWAVADLTGVGTVSPTPSAIGHLEAEITPFSELSPQSLAAAVWNTTVAALDDDGTTGFALRVLNALGRNRVTTDPVAGTYTVYDDDDSPLLVGDLWQDADGTAPYVGNGAERRDRLV
jgi:hypothetical protein